MPSKNHRGRDYRSDLCHRSDQTLEDHFDSKPELERALLGKGKDDFAEAIRNIVSEGVRCIFLHQSEALRLSPAILCAEPTAEHEPFVVLLANDLMRGNLPTQQLVDAYQKEPGTSLSVMVVAPEDAQKYGIVFPDVSGGVAGLVEKPAPGSEPSLLVSIGCYVLELEKIDILRIQPPGKGSEVQLVDAINTLATQAHLRTLRLAGRRYDCGSKS